VRADRGRDIARLARRLHAAGWLRPGLGERRAFALLMVLTSYETYRELRVADLSEREIVSSLQDSGRALLLA
jgi:hypothetical protein